MNRILRLDELTSSKIAAGEVVEKPAMIVKELFENSVDAGSTEITVEIEKGGKRRIRVTDNGSGIPSGDVPLAFERHATSKIQAIDDLYYTRSFGFRGEALASIAAVSKVTMTTRTAEDELGRRIVVTGGEAAPVREVAATVGTDVEITDLFFNTPVRLKFLKPDGVEQKYVVELMQKLAIANTQISIRFIMDGEQIFHTDGRGDLASAIYVVFGKQIMQGMNRVDEEIDSIRLSGFVSNFSNTRGNRNYQFVFVNGRIVRSDEVREAIALAYRPYLMKNNYPIVFLFLDLHPSRIDVNIHPAKTEIKFEDPGAIKQLVYTSLKKTFNRSDQVPRTSRVFGAEPERFRNPDPRENRIVDNRPTVFERFAPREPRASSPEIASITPQTVTSAKEAAVPAPTEAAPDFAQNEFRARADVRCAEIEGGLRAAPRLVFEEEAPYVHTERERLLYDELRYVGTLADSYLLYQKEGDLYLIDQHAAHEKILFEQFMDAYRRGEQTTQMLLLPLEEPVHEGNRDRTAELERMGFVVRPVDGDRHRIAVTGIPSEFSVETARTLLRNVLDEVDADFAGEAIAEKACKAAIKAHDVLMPIERDALIARLCTLRDPYNCPHGRPIVICVTAREIETRFRRIV